MDAPISIPSQSELPRAIRFLFLIVSCLSVAGCGGSTDSPSLGASEVRGQQTAPFEGHWRKYDDPQVRFVKFQNGKCTIGDKEASLTGSFSFEIASNDEPLYKVTAKLPDREEEFQLYYEEDTVFLTFNEEARTGLYEITFNAPQ